MKEANSIPSRSIWPEGKTFAFTIWDDTDFVQLPDIKIVYDLLKDLGFRTTKSVWPIKGIQVPKVGGVTCEDASYLKWVLQLQSVGFEIGLHNVTYHTSTRADTILGLDHFAQLFGHDPYTYATHTGCMEGMYWGSARLTGWREALYNGLLRNRYKGVFQGHVPGSPLFWGDVCQARIHYVRNFVYRDINTLRMCPVMPYHDPSRPYVGSWFASSEGPDVESFVRMLSEPNQDRLREQGGACIMYTHLAQGFCRNSKLSTRFTQLMQRLAGLGGWYVPVRELLDYLKGSGAPHVLTDRERRRLEVRWLWHKIKAGGTT